MRTPRSTGGVVISAGIAVLVTVALAFATTAWGTAASDSPEIAKLQREVAALKAAAREHRAMQAQIAVLGVSTRIAFIEAAGIHGMEGSWATAGGLTTRNVSALQNVLAVTSKIAWPGALKEDASAFVTPLRATLSAWQAGNKEEAFTQLKAAHAAYHALVATGYQWLS